MQVATKAQSIEDFYPLSSAEQQFVEECCAGKLTMFATQQNRTIRAELVRYFLLGGCETNRPMATGIRIANAKIVGVLNLRNCKTQLELFLFRCEFEQSPDLSNARLGGLYLAGSTLPGLIADHATIDSNFFMNAGFHSSGETKLVGATIGGQLGCNGAMFHNRNGHALNAQGIEVKGGVFLGSEFKAIGETSLSGATIDGILSCEGGWFENQKGHALNAQGVKVKGSVFLGLDFNAIGVTRLSGAKIGGQLSFEGGKFDNHNGNALNAEDIEVQGNVFLRSGFKATGETNLSGAKIGGQLSCQGGIFENENGNALNAEDVAVKGDVFLSYGFSSTGETCLAGGIIGGQLNCASSTFENKNGYALSAHSIEVKGALFMRDCFCDWGTLDLRFSKIGVLHDNLDCWPENRFFIEGFEYETIIASEIAAEKRLEWLSKHRTDEFAPQPYEQLAKVLNKLGHRRDAALVLAEMEKRLRPEIRERMRIKKLDGTWSLAFNSLWQDFKRFFSFIVDWFLGVIVGYGYRPSRAFNASILLILLASFMAYNTWNAGDMVPNSPILLVDGEWKEYARDRTSNAAEAWTRETDAGRDYETFSSVVYALDVFVPIIDFGQESAWAPSTERGWWGRQLYWMRWAFKIFGWIITALGAAAVTGIIRQDR